MIIFVSTRLWYLSWGVYWQRYSTFHVYVCLILIIWDKCISVAHNGFQWPVFLKIILWCEVSSGMSKAIFLTEILSGFIFHLDLGDWDMDSISRGKVEKVKQKRENLKPKESIASFQRGKLWVNRWFLCKQSLDPYTSNISNKSYFH